MIEISAVTKSFGPIRAVDGVTFSVQRGEVLGFLGPNGAGKSTTMKVIAGYLAPTSGSARVCGFDVVDQPIEAKKRVGYLPEGAPAYADMTPASFLEFCAAIRGYDGAERAKRVATAVEATHLDSVLYRPIDTLSKGFKRRVGLAQALLHDPDVMILDEPTDGLDPNQKHEVRTLIRKMAPEKAIIISTHLLEEVTAVCTRALIISKGRIVADGTPEELEARSRHHNAVSVRVRRDVADTARAAFGTLPAVEHIEETAGPGQGVQFMIFPRGGRPIVDQVSELVRIRGWAVDELFVERGRLDDVFRDFTQRPS
jgi:gliding motility-associated transport system ATP-binding protein